MGRLTIHSRISLLLKAVLLLEIVLTALSQQWLTMLITTGILAITLFPLLAASRWRVFIPPEFELLAIAFIFCSLFLGEVRDFYHRIWWWDIALHGFSGLLLGIVGFLLVHVLNEAERLEVHMKPGFVAFFSFMFAVGVGALWEIFEFAMDTLFGLDMQKAMFDDPSGLTDTMWDLILDTIGAAIISVLGYGYLRTKGNESFLEIWIQHFIDSNPRLFRSRDTDDIS